MEDLWSLWARLAPPSKWPTGTTAYFFRDGFEPSWEAWRSGGAWSLSLARTDGIPSEAVDAAWQALHICEEQDDLLIDVCPLNEIK